MRSFALPLLIGLLAAGSANASSFVVLEPMKEKLGPSMIVLGEPEDTGSAEPETAASATESSEEAQPQETASPGGFPPYSIPASVFHEISPSIMVMNDTMPPVTMEKVASISDEDAPSRHWRMPMVIRGGIVGDAFTRTVPVATSPADSGSGATSDKTGTDEKSGEKSKASGDAVASSSDTSNKTPAKKNTPEAPATVTPEATRPSPPTYKPL